MQTRIGNLQCVPGASFQIRVWCCETLLGKGEGRNIRRWKFARCQFSIPYQNFVQEANQLDVFLLLSRCLWSQGLLLKTGLSQSKDLFLLFPLEARDN